MTPQQTVELFLEDVGVPEPEADEVVVQVAAAPINPSDLGLLLAGGDPAEAVAGGDEQQPTLTLPLSPAAAQAAAARQGHALPVGNEGAGTVVAAGSSERAQALLGRLVALAGGGMYAEYRTAPAAACLPLPDGTPADQAAASFINPMTVLAMLETMRAEGHTALVHTAAASNLGQMLLRVCLQDGVPLVNIVRSAEQERVLRDAGATHVCDSSADGFAGALADAVAETGATLAFDAVGGGRLADRILTAMEAAVSKDAEFSRYGSTVHKQVYVYGGLDRSRTELSRGYGMAWGVGGWLVTPQLQKAGRERTAELRRRVAENLTTSFASHFTDEVSLPGALTVEAVQAYARQATGQKFLVRPS